MVYDIADDYYENVYGAIIQKVPKAKMHLFEHGDHPAMLSDFEEFYGLSMDFFGVWLERYILIFCAKG